MSPLDSKTSASPHPSVGSLSQGDTLMMGFEFIDEKGHFNPRKVLYLGAGSAKQSKGIVGNMINKLREWVAKRWVENYLSDAKIEFQQKSTALITAIDNLLLDIKTTGHIYQRDFTAIANTIELERNQLEKMTTGTESLNDSPRKSPRTRLLNTQQLVFNYYDEKIREARIKIESNTNHQVSHQSIIDASEWKKIKAILPQKTYEKLMEEHASAIQSSSKKNDEGTPEKSHIAPLSSHMLVTTTRPEPISSQRSAYDAIREKIIFFDDLSAPPPRLLSEIISNGFVDYCKHGYAWLKNLDLDSLEKFASLPAKDWEKYKNLVDSEEQFKELTSKRDQLMIDIEKSRNDPEHTQHRPYFVNSSPENLSVTKPILAEIIPPLPEQQPKKASSQRSADELIYEKMNEFEKLSRPFPPLLSEIIASGFFFYCRYGYSYLENLDLGVLENFVSTPPGAWEKYRALFDSDDQFKELTSKREQLIIDMQKIQEAHEHTQDQSELVRSPSQNLSASTLLGAEHMSSVPEENPTEKIKTSSKNRDSALKKNKKNSVKTKKGSKKTKRQALLQKKKSSLIY